MSIIEMVLQVDDTGVVSKELFLFKEKLAAYLLVRVGLTMATVIHNLFDLCR